MLRVSESVKGCKIINFYVIDYIIYLRNVPQFCGALRIKPAEFI